MRFTNVSTKYSFIQNYMHVHFSCARLLIISRNLPTERATNIWEYGRSSPIILNYTYLNLKVPEHFFFLKVTIRKYCKSLQMTWPKVQYFSEMIWFFPRFSFFVMVFLISTRMISWMVIRFMDIGIWDSYAT